MTEPSNDTEKYIKGRKCPRLQAFLLYNRYDSLNELTHKKCSGQEVRYQ